MALLTRWGVLAADRPQGFRVLADFLDQRDAGQIPQTDAVKLIGGVFERLLRGEVEACDLDRALALRAGPGRPARTSADLEREAFGDVASFVQAAIDADATPRGARERAIVAAAERFRRDRRSIERLWSRAAPIRRGLRAFAGAGRADEALPNFTRRLPREMALRAARRRPPARAVRTPARDPEAAGG